MGEPFFFLGSCPSERYGIKANEQQDGRLPCATQCVKSSPIPISRIRPGPGGLPLALRLSEGLGLSMLPVEIVAEAL